MMPFNLTVFFTAMLIVRFYDRANPRSPRVTECRCRRGASVLPSLPACTWAIFPVWSSGNIWSSRSCCEHIISSCRGPFFVSAFLQTLHAQMIYDHSYIEHQDAGTSVLDIIPRTKGSLREALTVCKRRLNEILLDLGDKITQEQAAVGPCVCRSRIVVLEARLGPEKRLYTGKTTC